MKWTLIILAGLVVAAMAGALWFRLAPSDPALWHADPAEGVESPNSHVAQVVLPLDPAGALAAFDRAAMSEPRTSRLAGSVEEGRITYVSRSRFWGFPDYTTVSAEPAEEGALLVIHARARFGQSDLGVNAARVGRWLAAVPDARPAS